jgi:hypothetical protein
MMLYVCVCVCVYVCMCMSGLLFPALDLELFCSIVGIYIKTPRFSTMSMGFWTPECSIKKVANTYLLWLDLEQKGGMVCLKTGWNLVLSGEQSLRVAAVCYADVMFFL